MPCRVRPILRYIHIIITAEDDDDGILSHELKDEQMLFRVGQIISSAYFCPM